MTEQPWVLITGASSGIGAEMARIFAARGYPVVAVARREAELQSVAASAPAGVPIRPETLDVTDRTQVAALHARLKADGISPQILVLNAGLGLLEKRGEFPLDLYRRSFEVNVFGVLNFIDEWMPEFAAQGRGTFAVTSSLLGWRTQPRSGAYAATKAAITFTFEALRATHGAMGIRFVTLHPAFVDTPMLGMKNPPFNTWTAAKAAEVAVKGILAGRDNVYFQPLWTLLSLVAYSLPSFLHRLFFALPAPRKGDKGESGGKHP